MSRIRIAALLCLSLVATSAADYLSDYQIPVQQPVPVWEGGLDYVPTWATFNVDHWLELQGAWRPDRHVAVTGDARVWMGGLGTMASVGVRWLPSGKLRKDGYEDWLQGGVGAMVRKAARQPQQQCVNLDSLCTMDQAWTPGPALTLSFGRDLKPWDSLDLGFRLAFEVGWVFGDALAREATGVFGMSGIRYGNLMLAMHVGGFVF